jgi:O-antigen ligase
MFILTAGYNVYQDGSKYHTGYYLLFLLAGLGYVFTDLKTAVKIMKGPVAIAAVIFLLAVAISQMYPGIEARPASDLEKILLILLSLIIIGQFVSGNTVLFGKIMIVGVVAVALVAIHHLYRFYLVDGHPISDRLTGYFIPENSLYLAQSFGFFFIAAVYLAVENRRSPVILVLTGASACILVFAAVATQSRSFVVASMAALILPFAGRGGKTVVIVLASALMIFVIIFYMNPSIMERTEFLRPQIWKQALDIISERPFLGWGGDYYPEIRIESLSQVLRDPHNILLTIWLKYGALSFITLTVLLSYAVSVTLRNTDNATLRFGGALLIFGVSMLFFEGHNIISKLNSTWHMVWIPLGIIMGAMHEQYHGSGSGKVVA